MIRRKLFRSYVVAPATVTASLAVALLLRPSGVDASTVFVVAVMVSAWCGGLGPGLLATALAVACTAMFFAEPLYSMSVGLDDLARLAAFVAVAILISSLRAASRHSAENLRVAKEAAEAASRAKDHLLAVVSHELRTPLHPALAAAATLAADESLLASTRDDLRLIHRNIELEARLIDDLLDQARLAQGKLRLARELLDVHALISEVVRLLSAAADAKRLHVVLDLRAPEHHVHGDPTRLRQVIWNLLQNAVKFTPPGGRVTVGSMNEDGRLLVRVTDTWIGIDAEVLPAIFHAFEQGGPRAARQSGGLGLGLSICKALVDAHGGRLTAASPGEGQGATFLLELHTAPTTEPHAVRPGGPPGPVPAGRPRRRARILLVDDHEDTLRVMCKLLRAGGHDVQGARGVREAVEWAEAHRFDLVISDVGLADGSGLDLMRTLRALHGMTGIALTGYSSDEDRQRSYEAGFSGHLAKPVSPRDLEAVIGRLAPGPSDPTTEAHPVG